MAEANGGFYVCGQLARKFLAVTLTLTLASMIMSILSLPSSSTSTNTIIKVEPLLTEFGNSVGDPIPIPGTQFNVTVKIYNVTDLYGFDLKFRWNTTFLRYVNHFVYVPRNTYPDGVLWNPIFSLADEVNTSAGTYWIAYASMAPAPSFNGTGTVFTMIFEILNQPYDYETGGHGVDPINITLDFLSTDLAALGGEPIPHMTEGAIIILWEKLSQLPSYPILKVMPTKVGNLPVGNTFYIDVWILGINQSYDIANFSITLNFNSTLIEGIEIAEGSWPKSYAEDSIPILKQINNTRGTAIYAVELVPPRKPEPPTTGILFTVTFHVIYESSTYPPPSCELTLSPTEIFDRNSGFILHTTDNGTFTAYIPPPVAKFTWTPSGNILPRGQIITFNASESYLPLGIKRYIWDFGDGNITAVETVIITHIYQATGTVIVVLNVTDDENFWAVANATLYIIDEPQTPPTVSVVNPLTGDGNFEFFTNITFAGSRFNVTIHAYNVADLQAYQIHLEYNSTFLNSTRAWLPTWNTTWVFYGKATTAPQPTFGHGYLRIADFIKGNYPSFSGTGILYIIEFEIIYAPTAGEISCSLNINNTDTLLLDSNWNEISSVIKKNGDYIYIYKKLSSAISITISPSIINFGESVTISGVIDPPRSTNITLLYRLQGETEWTQLATVQTDTLGHYSYVWTPDKEGIYELKAIWLGDENTNPAESEPKTVKVVAQPIETLPYILGGITAVAIIVALGIYFAKIRKRK
ncbi:MAG: PKD domain-containing protein [Candidatus Bathyarchaeia archaeon]